MAILDELQVAGEGPLGPVAVREEDDDTFIEALGERIALMGSEGARMEIWAWPLLVLHDLTVDVIDSASGAAVPMGARTARAVPEGVVLEWRSERCDLDVSIVAARDDGLLVLLYEVDPKGAPLEVGLSFQPAMRPMWPAGLGGQLVDRDEPTGAILLSEEIGRYAVLVGCGEEDVTRGRRASTAGRGVRERRTIRARVDDVRRAERALVFAVASAHRPRRPLSTAELRGGNQSATGFARASNVIADARTLLTRGLDDWPELLVRERRRWRDFLERTPVLDSGDVMVDDAFLWSKIALERAWVNVPGVGRAVVAGFGPGRGGERPGFAWFFNGDAFEACLAYAALGEFDSCREILSFAATTQRSDGKLTHEITLSAELCDWYADYPYAYYKGNQTPEYVVTIRDYVERSGDVEFARDHWTSIRRAIEWCRSTCDADGVMRIPEAGIAAVEAGPIANRVDAELFLQASWLEAQRAATALAQRLGESIETFPSAHDPALARRAFVDPASGDLAFARLTDGSFLVVSTVYSAQAMARGVIDVTDDEVRALADPALTTPWGSRMFSADSELYDAEHYNTGSVFPFLTQNVVRALRSRGFVKDALEVLHGQARLVGIGGPGVMPEFLAGDRERLLPHSVPHQTFSHAPLVCLLLEEYG